MWRTRYVNGVPDTGGMVEMLSLDLPMPGAVVNVISVGTFGIGNQPPGSFGRIFLDELSFAR
jgi:hypothetical protein